MPCVKIMLYVWMFFTQPFVYLLMPVRDKYINSELVIFKEIHAAMKAFLLHMVTSFDFIALFKNHFT